MTALFRTGLAFVISALLAVAAWPADSTDAADDPLIRPAGDSDLSEFVWEKRPIIVFADSENDPSYLDQIELLSRREGALRERDVVVLTDTDASRLSPVRERLRPRGFMLVVISKEGRVELRKPFPWDVREITRAIDKMPIRQREVREQKGTQ